MSPQNEHECPEHRQERTHLRRHDDCVKMATHEKLRHANNTSLVRLVKDYFLISAAITVMVLAYKQWKVLVHLDEYMSIVSPAIAEQNATLHNINDAVREQGKK